MQRMGTFVVLWGVAMWLLIGCATPPQPFVYEPGNELQPGPGLFTGEAGVYTFYGRPDAAPDQTDPPGEEALVEPDEPADP